MNGMKQASDSATDRSIILMFTVAPIFYSWKMGDSDMLLARKMSYVLQSGVGDSTSVSGKMDFFS